ncbi:hypothetical protein Avbf_03728 [Armadillidium vulgare]|nr:hypothetical protein Avbf_03728 [Armadillidium vulgare]
MSVKVEQREIINVDVEYENGEGKEAAGLATGDSEKKMVNESVSVEDLYNESLHAAFRIDNSLREEDVDENRSYGSESTEFCVKRLKSGKVKNYPVKQEPFYPAESFVSKEEDEIDSFAKSIAAQMKMLREEDTIELTFEIQNLVTQRRRKLMEAKLAEKQVENNDLQQEVITVSVDHPQLSNVVTNRH